MCCTILDLMFVASGLDREVENGSLQRLLAQPHINALLNLTDGDGCTPLMSAAQDDEINNIKALCKAGALVNAAAERTGLTALMQAAACGRVSAVSWLLTNGADVNQTEASSRTALDHACAAERTDGIDLNCICLGKRLLLSHKSSQI